MYLSKKRIAAVVILCVLIGSIPDAMGQPYKEYLVSNAGTTNLKHNNNSLSLSGKREEYHIPRPDSIILDGKWVKIHKKKVEPTLQNVVYGPDERNKLDFWKAESSEPTPLVFYIHGGGWIAGSKESNKGPFLNLLDEGVSYVSINYRLSNGEHTLPSSVNDAARALQFVRSKAEEWNIDPDRIIATGGSAGGCSSLWLTYHDDLADPDSNDPVARQSTRILAAAVIYAQTTINPWLVEKRVGPSAANHAMIWKTTGAKSLDDLFTNWDKYKHLSIGCSPLTHVSSDDPPVFMVYKDDTPSPGDIHHVEFGRILKEKCNALGLTCTIEYYDKETRQAAVDKFMMETFNKEK
ncbi:MAG TPA: alpha/beta hydrolase [Bacteroidales bacterium]|nr:alpha/beta hydrolase [Bacteroidales bacterium]